MYTNDQQLWQQKALRKEKRRRRKNEKETKVWIQAMLMTPNNNCLCWKWLGCWELRFLKRIYWKYTATKCIVRVMTMSYSCKTRLHVFFLIPYLFFIFIFIFLFILFNGFDSFSDFAFIFVLIIVFSLLPVHFALVWMWVLVLFFAMCRSYAKIIAECTVGKMVWCTGSLNDGFFCSVQWNECKNVKWKRNGTKLINYIQITWMSLSMSRYFFFFSFGMLFHLLPSVPVILFHFLFVYIFFN